MKCFAAAATLALWIAAVATAQVPNLRAPAPPEVRKPINQPNGSNQLQKIQPRNKMVATPAKGKGKKGKNGKRAKKMKNGSK